MSLDSFHRKNMRDLGASSGHARRRHSLLHLEHHSVLKLLIIMTRVLQARRACKDFTLLKIKTYLPQQI